MVKKIEVAIPTEKYVQDIITNGDKDKAPTITPQTAEKYLREKIISDPHNFVCSTHGCNAPVTCCSYKPEHIQATHFRTPSKKRHLHIEGCLHRVDYYQTTRSEDRKQSYKLESNNKIVSTLSRDRGFTNNSKSNAVTSNYSEETSTVDGGNAKRTKRTDNSDSRSTRKVSSELNTLRAHVELYEHSPKTMIVSPDTSKEISIEQMFSSIKRNKVYSDVNKDDLLRIYKGRITIYPREDGKFMGKFNEKVNVQGTEINPRIFFTNNFIKKNYPEKYKEYKDNNKIECTIYLVYSFFLTIDKNNNKHLNFAQFSNGKKLMDNTFGLKDNLLLR